MVMGKFRKDEERWLLRDPTTQDLLAKSQTY